VKWDTEADIQSVDGRTFHDIVVTTMMPGHAPDHAAREFARIIAHLGADDASDDARSKAADASTKHDTSKDREERSDEDEAVIRQLGAARRPKRRRNAAAVREGASAPSSGSALSTGFNPLVNARVPRKR
jgi:hypothetical protein